MTDAINEEWEKLQLADFQASIDSLLRRVQLVIQVEGGAICYWLQLVRLVEIRGDKLRLARSGRNNRMQVSEQLYTDVGIAI